MMRFTHGVTCPVCGGCEEDERGNGKRCYGFISGEWAHCTRIDFANGCDYHEASETFSHRLKGKCRCGATHNEGDPKRREKILEKTYTYRDRVNKVVHETLRYRLPSGDKTFMQRRPDGMGGFVWSLKGITPVLYNLPAIIEAKPDEVVWIVEGEKDADNLISRNRLATCNPMGALKWRESYSEILRGRHCRIIPDNDDKGRQHARQVAQSLQGKVASVRVVELPHLPPKGDVSDWLANGGTIKQLEELATKEPNDTPNDDPLLKANGEWIACQRNSEIWLMRKPIGKLIRYDTFRQAVIVDDKPRTDELVISLTSKIETEVRVAWNQNHVKSALINLAMANQYSSLTDWLDVLTWDGQPRIDTFFHDVYGADPTDYTVACSRILFLSAVARAYQPGCQADVMVVLIGAQGIGKSSGIFFLCPDPTWYTDDLGAELTGDKPGMGLRGKWLFEFSEFTRINRATNDAVKSFISRRTDHYRVPWGHCYEDYPRTCIFIGTTNDETPLRDVENRRFMPVKCTKGDTWIIKENLGQLWAEAVSRYKKGEKWHVADEGVATLCREAQEEARSDDVWEAVLRDRLTGREQVTMQEAAEKLDVKLDRFDRATQTRIGVALVAIGFRKMRLREGGERIHVYRRDVAIPVARYGRGMDDITPVPY